MNNEKQKDFFDYFELIISFIKAVIWPLLILYLFLSLQAPLTASVEQFPRILSKTSSITISGVTLDIDQRLRSEASPQLREALARLSPDALKLLVRTDNNSWMANTSSEFFLQNKAPLKELENAGLINITIGKTDQPDIDVYWKATELGREAYSFILEVIIDQMLRAAPSTSH